MSIMRAKETFFHSGGVELGGTHRADDDPLVAQFPSFYELLEVELAGSGLSVEPGDAHVSIPARRGRPPGSRNKPKPEDDGDGS